MYKNIIISILVVVMGLFVGLFISANQHSDKLGMELEKASEQFSELERSLDRATKEGKLNQSKSIALDKEKQGLETELNNANSDLSSLKREVATLQRQVSGLTKEKRKVAQQSMGLMKEASPVVPVARRVVNKPAGKVVPKVVSPLAAESANDRQMSVLTVARVSPPAVNKPAGKVVPKVVSPLAAESVKSGQVKVIMGTRGDSPAVNTPDVAVMPQAAAPMAAEVVKDGQMSVITVARVHSPASGEPIVVEPVQAISPAVKEEMGDSPLDKKDSKPPLAEQAEAKGTPMRAKGYTAIVAELKPLIKAKEMSTRVLKKQLFLTFSAKDMFAGDGAQLSPKGKQLLDAVSGVLNGCTDMKFLVLAHTSDQPVSQALKGLFLNNWDLSAGRALAVEQYLRGNSQLGSQELWSVGRSSYDPLAPNDSPENMDKNSRVEIILSTRS